MTGSVINNLKSARTPKNIHRLEQGPRKSVKHLTQQLNLEVSLTYTIIPGDVKLFLYKIQQALHKANNTRGADFCGDNVFGGQYPEVYSLVMRPIYMSMAM